MEIFFTGNVDQNHQDETTIYWFKVKGKDYGVAESCGKSQIIDCDGCPVNMHDAVNQHLNAMVVTEEMRQEY